jgi:hypothetical protein
MHAISPAEQARHLAGLEASFVAEIAGLKAITLIATQAAHPQDLEPHVESWIADWGDYHARNGHGPVIKAALCVALDRLSVQRIAAAVWTHHRQLDVTAPESVTLVTQVTHPRIAIPPRGPRGVRQIMTVNGKPVAVPAAVADFLRDLAHDGTARARAETLRKLAELTPWAAEQISRDPSAKVINHKPLYRATPDLRAGLKSS